MMISDSATMITLPAMIGMNCNRPWISPTSDDERDTSWPVCIWSWPAKSRRWSRS